MEVAGKPTVHPVLFFAGKAAGYFTWLALALTMSNVAGFTTAAGGQTKFFAYAVLTAGAIMVLFSSFTLGRSIRIGLPTEETTLRTGGIYRISRNPMYLGVHLITLAAMLLILTCWVIIPGLFSFYTYHRIILGEEKFLTERFGQNYELYKQKIRRYI